MGYSISWFAVREENTERLLERLGLKPTGETEDIPESLISMAKLTTGWRLLWYNQYDCPFLQPKELARISAGYDVIKCLVEEHVMASSSERWSGGQRQWWISHEGENGPKGLDVDGQPPEGFPAIRAEMEQSQQAAGGSDAGVDYIFEIPLKVAQSLVGFKHDENYEKLLDGQFAVMARTPPKTGLFQRLFK
jgi:hypothetical protein